jgi:hypothetical protein
MAMLHASTFLIRRAALLDPDRLGLVAVTRMVRIESVLAALHRRGRGI